ncbi:MAG: RNA-guided pseudouridylation complex pseudouridine synthase subunit Cbf5 [Candidatus Micrarchaeota archaeon]
MLKLHSGEYALGTPPGERSVKQLLEFGIIPIDKPRGPSSHEVSSLVRKLTGAPRTGHSGTLDPNVSGVLPVLLGKACKLARLLTSSRKEYVCEATFQRPVTHDELEGSLLYLQGEIYQTPPLQSAVKKALRTRKVYELKLLEHDGNRALFRAGVQAGTYIRTLVRDAGIIAGVEAHMSDLRRTIAAGIPLEKCVTLQEFSDRLWLWKERGEEKPLRKCLLPPESTVKLRKVIVGDETIRAIRLGSDVAASAIDEIDDGLKEGSLAGVFTGRGELVAIARCLHDAGKVTELAERERVLDIERVF